MCLHRYADEILSEDEAVDAAKGVSKKASKAESVASPVPPKLEIAAEDVPTVQLSGLDLEQICPPTPQTPDSFGRSLGLDEEELQRGMADEDEDEESGSETPQAQLEPNPAATAEEGVPPSGAVTDLPAAVNLDKDEWDDV